MPIYRIRTIYWKYRSQPSSLGDAMAGILLGGATAIELRRIHAGRKKENHDHGRGPSRWRQPEFADRGPARAHGQRILVVANGTARVRGHDFLFFFRHGSSSVRSQWPRQARFLPSHLQD